MTGTPTTLRLQGELRRDHHGRRGEPRRHGEPGADRSRRDEAASARTRLARGGDRILGVVEAKKRSVDPRNVLVQAERYARGLTGAPVDFHGDETHFHVGAGIPFGLLWTALVRDIAKGPTLKIKAEVGTPPFRSDQAFAAMLLAAATGRLVLAAYLWRRQAMGAPAKFGAYLDDLAKYPDILAARVPWGFGAHEARRALFRALHHLWGPGSAPPVEHARRLYQALAGRAPKPKSPERPPSIEDVIAAEPLVGWLPWREGLALPEARPSVPHRRGTRRRRLRRALLAVPARPLPHPPLPRGGAGHGGARLVHASLRAHLPAARHAGEALLIPARGPTRSSARRWPSRRSATTRSCSSCCAGSTWPTWS